MGFRRGEHAIMEDPIGPLSRIPIPHRDQHLGRENVGMRRARSYCDVPTGRPINGITSFIVRIRKPNGRRTKRYFRPGNRNRSFPLTLGYSRSLPSLTCTEILGANGR
jgi:hypothetical protein